MQQPIQPTFNKGDRVIYINKDESGQVQPEVCTIEAVIIGEYIIFYALKEYSEVVMESELIPLDDLNNIAESGLSIEDFYSGNPELEEKSEPFDFLQNFNYGDFVYVDGYEDHIFKVEGVIIEIFRYAEEEWVEVSYELEHKDLCIYAYDEDMTLVTADPKLYVENNSPTIITSKSTKDLKEIDINTLLDDYNDYMTLYHLFGEREYKELAEDVILQLKESSHSSNK